MLVFKDRSIDNGEKFSSEDQYDCVEKFARAYSKSNLSSREINTLMAQTFEKYFREMSHEDLLQNNTLLYGQGKIQENFLNNNSTKESVHITKIKTISEDIGSKFRLNSECTPFPFTEYNKKIFSDKYFDSEYSGLWSMVFFTNLNDGNISIEICREYEGQCQSVKFSINDCSDEVFKSILCECTDEIIRRSSFFGALKMMFF